MTVPAELARLAVLKAETRSTASTRYVFLHSLWENPILTLR